jgi:hypothetical protein
MRTLRKLVGPSARTHSFLKITTVPVTTASGSLPRADSGVLASTSRVGNTPATTTRWL